LTFHIGVEGGTADLSATTSIDIPTAPVVTNDTPWSKALDFNGSSEHTKQVSNSMYAQPIQMGGLANTVDLGTASQGDTSNNISARPWATAVVFKSDGYNGGQFIWNQGEGSSSSSNDNISLFLDGSGNLTLAWGRGADGYNQCRIATNISSSNWYGVYIAHSGERLGGNNASAANLADCFDIRLMSSADSFNAVGNNLSISGSWVHTGVRMDRTFAGDFTVGGKGASSSFRGKVASMLVTTLRRNQPMPNTTETKLMITDPTKWVDDYKVGNPYRGTMNNGDTNNFQKDHFLAYRSTMVWLMGDSTNDSYSNGMRNDLYSIDQNWTKMQLNSMVSNDIETVSIPGLT
jgi:parallel beta-helix repeat protein